MSPAHGTVDEGGDTGEPRHWVQSPEQVALALPLAGPTTRIFAYAIDAVLIYTLELALLLLLFFAAMAIEPLSEAFTELLDESAGRTAEEWMESGAVLYLVAGFLVVQLVIEWTYFVGFDLLLGGRSPGKALLGLRVLRDGGEPVDLRASLVRNLLRVVDVLPLNYLVGLLAMVISKESKRLGDLAAGTVVARLDRPPRALRAEGDVPPDDPRFRFDRKQLARIGREERALLRQTLRRADELAPETAAAAYARAAEVLAKRIGHAPVEAPEHAAFLRALDRAAR